MDKTTILIVEDEAIIAADLAGKLGLLGYEVVGTAATGEDAVEMACGLEPQVVLMDIRLKGPMDGIEAAEAITRRHCAAVIYLTAHSDAVTLARAKLSGPFGYILKPFEERELSTTIEMALYKHQSEQKLREQREWLQVTLSSIGDAVITCGTDGLVTFLNPVAEELSGWGNDEAGGRPIGEVFSLINEDSRRPPDDIVTLVLKEGMTKTLANHTALVTRDGREIPIEDSAAPILDASGRVIGAVIVFHDVTEKRHAQEALKRSHEELEQRIEERTRELWVANAYNRSLIEASVDPLVTIGHDGKITDVNTATEAVTGRSRAELIGSDFSDYFSEPDKARAGYQQVFRDGSVRDYPLELRHRGGSLTPVLYNASVYCDEQGKTIGVFAAARDITEQKKAQIAHQELNDTLEEQVIERTAQLKSANETLRSSRVAALNLMEDAVIARRESEETALALREREEQLRLFIEHAPAGLAMFDRDMRYIHASRSWRNDYKMGEREFAAVSHYELFPEIGEGWKKAHRRGLAGEVLRSEADRFERADGSLQWVRWEIRPWRDSAGDVGGIVIFAEDITESKRAEEALRESNQRTSLMAETTATLLASDSPQGVVEELCRRVMEVIDCQAFFNFLVDEKEGRLRLNACAGIPGEEVKKLEWLDYGVAVCGCAARDATRIVAEEIPDNPDPRTELVSSFGIRAYACHPMMARGRVLGTLSFGTRTRSGFTMDDLALMKTVTDHVAIAMERKRAEEEIVRAKEAAEAASRAKSQFLANMSHELRTPMTGVLGMLEFALNTTLEPQQREFIETAHKSARTLLLILNDILDLSKVEAGKLTVEAKPFVLGDCVAGAIDILLPEARHKGLELNCTMADDLPNTVVGDQVRLLQVLTNLCGNAVKFTEKGKVEVKVTAGGITSEGMREITFMVKDTGIGIPDDKKELIFGSFNQADVSHARRYGGTGLGLAISKELVERMGGTISCISAEGSGSTFSFTIPLEATLTEIETVSKPVAPPLSVPVPVSASKEKARLLLAEDDPITRQVIGLMLKHSNFDHDIAENGLRAVEMWEKGNYDLVLMDVQMPGQDGFAATGDIRERERERGGHTLIIAMTAHAFPEDEKRCLAAGMDAYIPKPIDLQKCIALIEELIAKRQLEA